MGLQLGLDISTSNVGWCLLEEDTGKFIDAGALELSKKKDIFDEDIIALVDDGISAPKKA